MSFQKPLNLDELIDYSVDYYALLGLQRGDLPPGRTKAEQEMIAQIIQDAYHAQCLRVHPDRLPRLPDGKRDERPFRLLLAAEKILSDPIARRMFDSGGAWRPQTVENGGLLGGLAVDWNKIGTYREGTPEESIGFALWEIVCHRAKELGLIPAFFPSEEQHNYEWDWQVEDTDHKIALSLVQDADEVLRLTSGEDAGTALPFKIYLCVPRKSLALVRERRVKKAQGKDYVIHGEARAAAYSDVDLLETTDEKTARGYLLETVRPEEAKGFLAGTGLAEAVEGIRSGSLLARQKERDRSAHLITWADQEKVRQIDEAMLASIFKKKSIKVVPQGDHAADFLQEMPDNTQRVATQENREQPSDPKDGMFEPFF